MSLTLAPLTSVGTVPAIEFDFSWLPPGIRFCPTDRELINFYLHRKLQDKSLPPNPIREINLYSYTPMELYAKYKSDREDAMYFFTWTEKKYPKGSRPRRSAGTGFWKASGADIPIDRKGRQIGARKVLVFYLGSSNGHHEKTDWIMYEYKIPSDVTPHPTATVSAPNDSNQLDKWVLCKIYERQTSQTQAKKRELDRKSPPLNNNGDMAVPLTTVTAPAGLISPPPHATDTQPPTEWLPVTRFVSQTAEEAAAEAVMVAEPVKEECYVHQPYDGSGLGQDLVYSPSFMSGDWDGSYDLLPPLDDESFIDVFNLLEH